MKLPNHPNQFCVNGCKYKNFYVNLLILQLSFIAVCSQPCQENSNKPNPKDCTKYYQCQHGSIVKMTCGGGLHFKVASGSCELPSVAGCAPGTATTTTVSPPTSIPVTVTSTSTTLKTAASSSVPASGITVAPTIPMSSMKTTAPSVAASSIITSAPSVAASSIITSAPSVAASSIITSAPSVAASSIITSAPSVAASSIITSAPTVTFSSRITSAPSVSASSIITSAPSVAASSIITSAPSVAVSSIITSAPSVAASSVKTAAPSSILTSAPIETSSTTVTTAATVNPSVPIGSGGNPTKPIEPIDFKVICYFTDWATNRREDGKFDPQNVDPSLCTHIIYSFALLNSTTFLMTIADPYTAIDKKFYENLVAFKSKGAKVMLAIGGWTDSSDGRYSTMVNDPVKRRAFVINAVTFLNQYNFDGLDLDWEYPRCWQGNCTAGPENDKAAFAQLVADLRKALPTKVLSAAVSVYKPIVEKAYDIPSLSKNLDWIGVMAYDLHTGYDSKTGHIAPLYKKPEDTDEFLNVDAGLTYWQKNGADPKKLIMGVPLYGNSFFLQNATINGLNSPSFGPGAAGPFTSQSGMLAYYEICKMLPTYTVVSDKTNAIGPYAYNGTGPFYTQWISYDDAAMAQVKANYVKTKNLGGVMVWALDLDDFNGKCGKGKYPILTALWNTLRPPPSLPDIRSLPTAQ